MRDIADELLARNRKEKEEKALTEEKSIIGLLSMFDSEINWVLLMQFAFSQGRNDNVFLGNVAGRDSGSSMFSYSLSPSQLFIYLNGF